MPQALELGVDGQLVGKAKLHIRELEADADDYILINNNNEQESEKVSSKVICYTI